MIEGLAKAALSSVTLVAVTSVAVGPTVDALLASMRQADFAQVLLLCDVRPANLDGAIKWRPIERLHSRADYCRFMLRELAKHISTDHALCIQWDGFVVNGAAWDPHFLDYDYIGAVWPHFHDKHNVGNGGFSLRSRRLLDACRHLPFNGSEPEDVLIGRLQRPRLEALGMRFAPEDVAQRFSFERTKPAGDEFGFHGVFNLVRYLPAQDAVHLFRSLEAGLVAPNERWELLRWALTRGHFGLAMTMVARLVGRLNELSSADIY